METLPNAMHRRISTDRYAINFRNNTRFIFKGIFSFAGNGVIYLSVCFARRLREKYILYGLFENNVAILISVWLKCVNDTVNFQRFLAEDIGYLLHRLSGAGHKICLPFAPGQKDSATPGNANQRYACAHEEG
ncbi:hypothetical protein CWS02_04100 [Enterobacter sp. EA-1]|nr:hypothetical protein CWS02_04100 [Enterobacter sp. EA-1]